MGWDVSYRHACRRIGPGFSEFRSAPNDRVSERSGQRRGSQPRFSLKRRQNTGSRARAERRLQAALSSRARKEWWDTSYQRASRRIDRRIQQPPPGTNAGAGPVTMTAAKCVNRNGLRRLGAQRRERAVHVPEQRLIECELPLASPDHFWDVSLAPTIQPLPTC